MNVGVIMLHALSKLRFVGVTDRGKVAAHFLPESQYPVGMGKFIYKPAIVDEIQLQDQLRSHKMLSTLGL